MNGKIALALILSLQVSLSLCELPTPSQELVDKYEGLKSVFYRRIINVARKAQEKLAPMVQGLGDTQGAQEYAQAIQTNPKFQTAVKIAGGLKQEVSPLVDKARLTLLAAYEEYLRPIIGTFLDDSINHAKFVLDRVLPAV